VGEIFRTRPDWPWGPTSLLHNGYRFFLGVKRLGLGVNHPPSSSAEVKVRVELYNYSPLGLHALFSSELYWQSLAPAVAQHP